MHLPPIPRFFVRWTIRLALLFILLGLPAALVYLREVGLGSAFRDQLAQALSTAKFRTEIGALLFDPFRGLIAEDVVVTDGDAADRPVAQVERVVVSLKMSDLLARRISVDFLELDRTDVSIPIGGEDAQRLNLQGVSGQFIFLGDQLRISSFDANLAGLRISLTGLLQNPQSFRPTRGDSSSKPAGGQDHRAVIEWLDRLEQIRFIGPNPELRMEVAGDLSDLSTLQVSPISLRSGPIVGPNWRIEGIEAQAQYSGGKVNLTQFLLKNREGDLNLSAQYNEKVIVFELSGSLDVPLLLNFLPLDGPWKDIEFENYPQIDASGSVPLPFSPQTVDVIGALHAGKFVLRQTAIDSLSVDFAWREGKFFAKDLLLEAAGGELKSDVLFAPNDFRIRLTDTVAPTVFSAFLGPKEREFIDLMEFRDRPFVSIEAQGTKPSFDQVSGQGVMKLGRTAIRGSWMESAESRLEIANRAVTYRDFTVKAGKGTGTGTFVYDFGARQVRLEKVNSTLPPVDVLMWADPKIADALRSYRFREPPKVQGGGMIHMEDPRQTRLSLVMDAQAGIEYELLKKNLVFGRTQGTVDIVGTKANVNLTSAKLMGGDVGVKAVISTDASNPVFGADIDVRRVDFARLTRLYFDYDDSKGVVSGNFSFNARAKEETMMKGKGSIKVEEGHVLSIPVLGPLSEIIDKIIPGSGFEAARQATADFQVADGKVSTPNLAIEGLGFSLYGHGDISFLTQKMDMSVRINARGVPGIVLFPVSKLFEYVSTGTFSEPDWRPKLTHFGDDEPSPSATPSGQRKARETGR